jgi:very-short-patch-repair endonuclease
MPDSQIDRRIESLARRQQGVFSRDQAEAAGATRRMIERRRRSGAWLSLERGVYALPSAPFTWLRQAKAAELRVPGSAVSHRGSAHPHGIDGYRAGSLDLTVASGEVTCRLARVHVLQRLTTAVREQITVTSLGLTLVQLAGIEPRGRLARAIDDILVRGLSPLHELSSVTQSLAGQHPRGVGVLQQELARRGDGFVPPTNELEAALWAVLEDPRIPPSLRQAPCPWRPEAPGRVDAFIPTWRRIVEADGRRWHTRRADFERDRWRDHQAQRQGFEVTRFTYSQLVESPAYAVEVLVDIGRRVRSAA